MEAAHQIPRPKPSLLAINTDKAIAEKWYLIYSPIWMIMIGLVMVLGIDEALHDLGFVVLGITIMAPFVILPLVFTPQRKDIPWYQTYWFKSNTYIFVFSFFGNYFGSEYFFDVLGMVYHYPTIHWNLDATLVGSGTQQVPVLMYLLTHAYFMTYHTTAVIVLRRLKALNITHNTVLFPFYVFVIGYIWAWVETKAMANPLIADNFYYQNKEQMLKFGSSIYAIYFLVSFPIFFQLDEKAEQPWSLWQTIAAALSASMLTILCLDLATRWIILF